MYCMCDKMQSVLWLRFNVGCKLGWPWTSIGCPLTVISVLYHPYMDIHVFSSSCPEPPNFAIGLEYSMYETHFLSSAYFRDINSVHISPFSPRITTYQRGKYQDLVFSSGIDLSHYSMGFWEVDTLLDRFRKLLSCGYVQEWLEIWDVLGPCLSRGTKMTSMIWMQ